MRSNESNRIESNRIHHPRSSSQPDQKDNAAYSIPPADYPPFPLPPAPTPVLRPFRGMPDWFYALVAIGAAGCLCTPLVLAAVWLKGHHRHTERYATESKWGR